LTDLAKSRCRPSWWATRTTRSTLKPRWSYWQAASGGAEVVWEPFEAWADHHPAERAATVLGFLRRADPHEI